MFSNRELALFTWIGVLIVWLLVKPSMRKSLGQLFRSAFAFKLSIFYFVVAAYTAGVAFLLYKLGLWDSSQLKNTVLWYFTVGALSLFDITNHEKTNYFKATLKDILGFTAILQFIIEVYSFSYIVELLIIPFAVLIYGTLVVAKRDPQHYAVAKLLNGILSLLVITVIGYTIYRIASDFYSFANTGTLSDFVIPAFLSFAFLPLLYLLSIYVSHEDVFAGLDRIIKKTALLRYARWKVFTEFHIHKTDLKRWRKSVFQKEIKSKKDVRKSIAFIKQLKRIEETPPTVAFEEGWSPYIAKEFLSAEAIKTGHYEPVYENEWAASSPHVELEGGLIRNSLAYYVSGDNNAANKIELTLNVHSPDVAETAHLRFLQSCALLYLLALHAGMPKRMEKAIVKTRDLQLKEGNRIVSFKKEKWEGHRFNGYELIFSIEVKE